MLPIELINEILCYAIDKSNYLDFLILNRRIHYYFVEEYEPYLSEVYRRSMILSDRSITVPASGRFKLCIEQQFIYPMIYSNIIPDNDVQEMKSIELKINVLLHGSKEFLIFEKYKTYIFNNDYQFGMGIKENICSIISLIKYRQDMNAKFLGYYGKLPIFKVWNDLSNYKIEF